MNILKNVTKGASKMKFKVIKKSPEILMGVGTLSIISGTVIACRQTFKFEEILDNHAAKLEARDKVIEEYGDEYTDSQRRKDTVGIYALTTGSIVKTYAVPTILIGGGIACMFLAKSIVSKRYMAALTAFNGLSEVFQGYRQRVKDKYGEDIDKLMLTGGETLGKKSQITFNDENGDEVTIKDPIVIDGEKIEPSIYARFFDPSCSQWEKNAEYNLTFLKGQEQYANDMLKTRGHLFLNEVYDMLGFDHSQAGSLVGWIYDETNPDADNYVDFGIYNMASAPNRNFVNGFEPVILLDFNVDGVIWDKI